MSQRFVTDEPLQVSPDLLGLPLASPTRRLVAFAVDYLVLLVPSLLLAVAVSVAAIWVRDPGAAHALFTVFRHEEPGQPERVAALRELAYFLEKHHAAGLPRELEEAMAGDRAEAVNEVLRRADVMVTFAPGSHREDAAVDKAAAPNTEATPMIHIWLEQLIPPALRAVTLYGVGALYFAAFTALGGATLGKRLVGIRVVRLDGHRLNFVESLERFIGYLHIPGSLFLDLRDLWRDPNRRLPHDRVVHTAVVRVNRLGQAPGTRSTETIRSGTAGSLTPDEATEKADEKGET